MLATICLSIFLFSSVAVAETNLLRNGSFEGGKRYWFEADPMTIVHGDAADGDCALRIDHGGIMSAAFLLTQGKPVLLSFSARAVTGSAVMGWQLSPASREVGTRNNLTWSMRHFHPVTLTDRWQRFSFAFTPTVPQDGFWPTPTYMLQLGDGDHPFLIDAVTVANGAGRDHYIPWAEVEVQANCPDLKGYADSSGNLLEKNQTVSVVAAAFNPGSKDRVVTLRWQLMDYEGVRPVNSAITRQVTIPAGKTVSETIPIRLASTGLVLARVSALDGDRLLDSSDIPLCSLPYPSQNKTPNWNERFGGSLFGDHSMDLAARVGFGWTRWRPHMTWSDHQPDGPGSWHWFDEDLDKLARRGFSAHFVMYDKPKWAFANQQDQLPGDMKWAVNDPRWDQMQPLCAWDQYVVKSVQHYKGRSIIFEIQNEPEFDWPDAQKELYARFTTRTARLIKQTNPDAKVMVNNVYAIPSGINRYLLEHGGGKFIDVISWHDYHEGWLADAGTMQRMRAALDDLGCQHIQIWFNEGWAFTNTAVDEPARALTHLSASQSTNAMVDSIAELTSTGQEKTVLFYTGYDEHGMSFWDYAGPGTMLWDYYGYPTPLVPAWNTLIHHIGLSDPVARIRPAGASLCVFQDHRNNRGVIVAFADRDSSGDVTVVLPLPNLIAEDAMGNAALLTNQTLVLSKTGRPVFLFDRVGTSGVVLAKAMQSLDRKNASFASGGATQFRLPAAWEGTKRGSADGNPILSGNQPTWRVDQVWPDDPTITSHYVPLVWDSAGWGSLENGFGGQPEVQIESGNIDFAVRGSWSGNPGQRTAALLFIAPAAGVYHLTGSASTKPWNGGAANYVLGIYKKDTQRAAQMKTFALPRDGSSVAIDLEIELQAGHEIAIVPLMPDWNNATHTTVKDLRVQKTTK